MITVTTTDINGKEVAIPEQNFQRSMLAYMRETSPNRVKIIAESKNETGQPVTIPSLILILSLNPSEVMSYTDVLPLEINQ
jgi:hypothetical protein